MLSVIIPTEGQESSVVATLAPLVPGAAAGVVREVWLVDRGGSNTIARVADVAGCRFLVCEGPRTAALAAGAKQARADWLMFLYPGTVLEAGWIDEIAQFMQATPSTRRAGIFRHERSPYARPDLASAIKRLRRALRGPAPEQGLVIARDHYDQLGGHAFAHHDETRLLRRLGRDRVTLRSRITVP
jgi:hypothetical protein